MNRLFLPFITMFAFNSVLTLGFGVQHLVTEKEPRLMPLRGPAVAMLLSGLLVWPFLAFILAPFGLGYLEAVFLAPLAVIISNFSAKILSPSFVAQKNAPSEAFVLSAYDGLTYATCFLISRLASNFLNGLLLAVGATIGYLFCAVILRFIRKRSEIEPIPHILRGAPLMLIVSGFMSIISSFLASAFFNSLGRHL